MSTQPSLQLERFANPEPNHEYLIHLEVPEFSCLCPLTGQPDFAVLTLDYLPHQWCIELKSLKLYLQKFRNHGAFYEHVTNLILDDLAQACRPRSMSLISDFTPRGGIRTSIRVDYTPPPPTSRRKAK